MTLTTRLKWATYAVFHAVMGWGYAAHDNIPAAGVALFSAYLGLAITCLWPSPRKAVVIE